MEIRLANKNEFTAVRAFYHSMIVKMRDMPYRPGWETGVYPDDELLSTAIEKKTMYLGRADGNIVAAMIVNNDCNESYSQVEWPVQRPADRVSVIHALGVDPEWSGKGLAKKMVRFAIDVCKANGQEAIRLDVLGGNLPATKLYRAVGFEYVQTLPMFYEDTGWTDFDLYEYPLS